MKPALKNIITKVFALRGNYISPMTKKDTVNSFFEKLYPISPGIELIRLGPDGDGGYLVPDDLENIEACFSPGVSDISGFERDCADLGMYVFLADHSIDQPQESHNLFQFTKKHVGMFSSEVFMTMENWVAGSLPNSSSDLILQMDIEGYEYEVLLGMSAELLRRFRILVIEFHFLPQLWDLPYFNLASLAFDKILQTHSCVHIHPNNSRRFWSYQGLTMPEFAEFTFLRNDRVQSRSYATQFPHPLDADNSKNPHRPLPKCWYKN